MDYQKKKLLTQSVSFMQANLTLTSETLSIMKAGGVLTAEEVSTIQKDEMSSGKVLELICLLKRKDNRTYSRFLQVLEELKCHALLQMLKSKAPLSEVMLPDPRTVHFLEHELGGYSVNQRQIKDMAVQLVLREIYQDEVNSLQDNISALQRQLRARYATGPEMPRAGSDSGDSRNSTPLPTTVEQSNSNKSRSLTAGQGEVVSILNQKDDIIKKKDEEYHKLRHILDQTQNDLQSVLDLNSQYLTIIGQLNQMQLLAAGTPRTGDKSEAVLDLENKLEESQAIIDQLRSDLSEISTDLETKEKELRKVLKRERKYKEMLGLAEDASETAIEEKIHQIKQDGSLQKQELDKIRQELEATSKMRSDLENIVTSLTREKEKAEFYMRQQELTMKKMKRMKVASHTIQTAEATIAAGGSSSAAMTPMRLPAIDRPSSQMCLAANMSSRPLNPYCMFCRQEFQPLKNKGCRAHFRPIRGKRWACCNDECHRSVGCLHIPHFYIEITVDKKVFLTDGARYMEIS